MAEEIDFSKIYSFSKLKRFKTCPLNYYFYYLDPKWKGFKKPRDYKTKGQAVHAAVTLFYYLPSKKRNFEHLKNCLEKAWFSEIDPLQKAPLGKLGGFKNLRHERKVYAESLKLLKNFFNLEEITPPIFYLPTEKVKDSFDDYRELIKPLNGEFSISGKFDRIDTLEDGALRIVDFKTNKGNQDKFQLLFYKLLAELNFNKEVGQVSFYYLNKEEIADLDVSDVQVDDIKKQVLNKIRNIKSSKFKPKVTNLCPYCDFYNICPTRRYK